MRKMLPIFLALAQLCRADQSTDPIAIFKSGDYARAIPLLQGTFAGNSRQDPRVQAALLSALVYQGRVEEAAGLADDAAHAFPQSPEVLTARGDLAFYMGDMPAAETLYKAALNVDDKTARAYYGLYRIDRAASMYRNARLLCFKAHSVDPDDDLITESFMDYLVPEKRKELLPAFAKMHPWFYGDNHPVEKEDSDLDALLHSREPFEIDGPRQEVTLPIHYLHDGPGVRGVGVDISIGGGRPLRVLLDTGASGLLLTQSAIDKAGLNHLGSFKVSGIGDKGPQKAFLAVADSCSIATLKLKTCLFEASEGKGRIAGDEDGLIGVDLFSDYLITIDFQKCILHLVPLPERKHDVQGYNRDPLPTEAGFTPVFRFGHHLYVSTKVNGKVTGLFLIDTGSNFSTLDSTLARLITKIHHNEYYVHVAGVSGKVNEVFEADKAELEFARFRQSNLGLTSINLNNGSGHQPVRMGGILGFQVLASFRLTLDYRNGLVNFDCVLDRK